MPSRTYYQRPGCLGWTAFFFIALCFAGIPSRLVASSNPEAERIVYLLSVVLIMWGLSRLFRLATSTTRAVCPPLRSGHGSAVPRLPELWPGEGGLSR